MCIVIATIIVGSNNQEYMMEFTNFFQIISVDYVDHSKNVWLNVITELYYIDLINLWFRIIMHFRLDVVFNIYFWKQFSVKKGTLLLRWVSSPGPFDCHSNALSSKLRRFHTTFFTESIDAYSATDISWTIY